jgi:hypothetical protein
MKKITFTTLGILLMSSISFSQSIENTTTSTDSTVTSPKKNAEIKRGATIDRSNIKVISISPTTPASTPVVKEEEVAPVTPSKNQPKKK